MQEVLWTDLPKSLQDTGAKAKAAIQRDRDIVLVGPPGTGKTSIARRLSRDIKTVDKLRSDALTVYRLCDLEQPGSALHNIFRAPHHTVSSIAMYGGNGRPGECSLAHSGVLLLDELPEFSMSVLEAVGKAHRDKVITFDKSKSPWIRALPANFALVVAFSPCSCGQSICTCTIGDQLEYGARVDRCIDALNLHNPLTVTLKSKR